MKTIKLFGFTLRITRTRGEKRILPKWNPTLPRRIIAKEQPDVTAEGQLREVPNE